MDFLKITNARAAGYLEKQEENIKNIKPGLNGKQYARLYEAGNSTLTIIFLTSRVYHSAEKKAKVNFNELRV